MEDKHMHLSYTVCIVAGNDLVMQGTRPSLAMVLT